MNQFPSFETHFDVWLIALIWSGAYWVAFVRIGARLGQPTRPTRVQLIAHCAAVLTFLGGSLWPVHDVAEKSLYFVHMAQHLAFINLMALFIVMSIPSWLARWILVRRGILPVVRVATRFLPATILFNVLIVVFHWPAFVTLTVNSGLIHFFAHLVMVLCFVVIWMVIVSPAPEIRRSTPIVQMIFLFLQSVIPTLPASFLTFGSRPLYKVYEDLPKLFSLSALEDQRIAGLVMKLGGGLLLWAVIAVIFFQWSTSETNRELRFRRQNANKL
ncbi:MAG TPA: cytochrome c oxidase assembly protein [Acidimicrobiia bacterium]|nr:cytochrome c oxidase assembly protein [Acidimicrobiia bacterium]